MRLNELEIFANELLDIAKFHDYSPNGLQVEGRSEVQQLVSGVTASLDFLEAAVAAGADAIIVHHGYFWRGENPCITGMKHRRISCLMTNQVGLLAYHLPLDAHPELGNNAQLGRRLGFVETGRFGEQGLGFLGTLSSETSLKELCVRVEQALSRKPLAIARKSRTIQRVAWCTGGAQDYFDEAIRLGVDAFLTGEISERMVHSARESDVAFISAGHHATERYGIQALGEHIAQIFGIAHHFIDIDSPV